jgi:hypothetical protein
MRYGKRQIRQQNPLVVTRGTLQLAFQVLDGNCFTFVDGRAARENGNSH